MFLLLFSTDSWNAYSVEARKCYNYMYYNLSIVTAGHNNT